MRGTIGLGLFLLVLLAETAYCYLHPVAYFDTFAYVSLQRRVADGNDFGAVGRSCAAALPGAYNGCGAATSSEVFAQAAALSPEEYPAFLRFYTVKPMYNLLAGAVRTVLGVDAWRALRVVSAGSFLLIGLVCMWWLRRLVSPALAAIGALCLVSLPVTLGLGRGLLPDALLTALLVLGAALLSGRRWVAGAGVLLLATLVRADALLLLGAAGSLLIWRNTGPGRRRLQSLGGFAAAFGGWAVLLRLSTGSYPWRVLFVHSFLAWTPPSGYPDLQVTLREYLQVMSSNGIRTVLFCLPLPLLLAAIALAGRRRCTPERELVWAGLAAVLLRLLLYPGVEERYYVWLTLIAGAGAVGAAGRRGQTPDALGESRIGSEIHRAECIE